MKKSTVLMAIVCSMILIGGGASASATTYVLNGKKSDKPHLYSYTDTDGNKHTGYWTAGRTWNEVK